jgi:hypothetical protein
MNLGRQQHSLVDCISYVIMYQNQIEKAFCFKRSYARQGFTLLASLDHTPPHQSKGDSGPIQIAKRS